MATYQKFSSPDVAEKVREAVLRLHPDRHVISYRLMNLLHRYFVYSTSTMVPFKKRLRAVKRIVNRDLCSFAWVNAEGEVLVGGLVETLVTPEAKNLSGGTYFSDLPTGALCIIEFTEYPKLVQFYDEEVAAGRRTYNPLTDPDFQ